MKMHKETAMKPIIRFQNYLKYGFVIMEHQYADCPRCGHVLNAGPNYHPNYCEQCGQHISFDGIEWGEERQLGFAEKGIYISR